MAEDLRTLSERVKLYYDKGLEEPYLYKMADNVYVVSFAIVASCQEDTLQKRLSHKRAISSATRSLLLDNFMFHCAFDVDAEFDPAPPETDSNDSDYVMLPTEPVIPLSEDDYEYDLTEKILISEHLSIEGMCPLMKFSGEKGEMVYAYYYLLPPKNSLKEEKKQYEENFKQKEIEFDDLDKRIE